MILAWRLEFRLLPSFRRQPSDPARRDLSERSIHRLHHRDPGVRVQRRCCQSGIHPQVIVLDTQAHTEIKRLSLDTDEFNSLTWCEGTSSPALSRLDGRSLLVLDCDVHLTRFENVIPEGMLSGVEKKAPAVETTTPQANPPSDKVMQEEEEEEVVTVRKLRREVPMEKETVPEVRDGVPGISTDDAFDGYQPDVGVPINVGLGAICED